MAVTLAVAKAHLRLEADYPDAQVAPYLGAAMGAAAQFLNRRLFADADELSNAIAAVPAALEAAGVARAEALAAADLLTDETAACALRDHACIAYRVAGTQAAETYAGLVTNEQIDAAILLIVGHLFANRQDVVVGASRGELPMGSLYLLQPFRVGLGA